MSENEKKPVVVSNSERNRRKTVAVIMAAFLLCGGGVFLFFVMQGTDDLKKMDNTFTQHNTVRESVASFFKSLGGITDEDPDLAKKRELYDRKQQEIVASGGGDMSSWMQPEASASASAEASPESRSHSRYVAPSGPAPRMSGALGGISTGGGGGSKSSGQISSYSPGASKVSIAGGASLGRASAGKEGGTLAALRNAQASLSDGLRSNSALTARTKWEQSFSGTAGGGHNSHGVKSAGGSGDSGTASYGKSGLTALDTIRTGEGSAARSSGATPPAASGPKLEKDLSGDMGKEMANMAAGKLASSAGNIGSGSGDKPAGDKPAGDNKSDGSGPNARSQTPGGGDGASPQPPPVVRDAVANSDLYCEQPCGNIKDGTPNYISPPNGSTNPNDWKVEITSTFYKEDGKTVDCQMVFAFDLEGNPPKTVYNEERSRILPAPSVGSKP